MSAAPHDGGFPDASAASRVPALDGLRGLAIALVMAFHLYPQGGTPGIAQGIGRVAIAGWCGVDLFFVLSGYLITGILLDHRDSPTMLRAFYGRRVLRIVPLYYVLLFLVFVVLPPLLAWSDFHGPFPNPRTFGELVAHQGWFWTFLQNVWMATHGLASNNLGMLWSLAIEEQFYLVWPLLVLACTRRRLAQACLALLVVATLRRTYLADAGQVFAAYYGTLSRLDTLAMGALCALVVRHAAMRARAARAAPAVACVLAVTLVATGTRVQMLPFLPAVLIWALPQITLLFGALLLMVVAPAAPPRALAILESRALRFLGAYSYALYLFHYPIHGAVTAYLPLGGTPGRWLAPLITIAVSIGIARLTWRTIEAPMLRLKRFLPYEGGGAPGAVPAGAP